MKPEHATGYEFRGFHVSKRMMGAIHRYIDHGISPGHFLAAVIDNDLREAVARADDENLANISAFVGYFYNEAPAACWGSLEKRRAWLTRPEFAVGEVDEGAS